MPESPHLGILDRPEAEKLIKEHFSTQVTLLQEIANYGSNLVIRAFNSSNKSLGDALACGVLLRQVVAMVDAVEMLVASGAVHAAHLPARAAFEASLYLEWMLVSDLDRKAKYYYVSNMRQERLWASRGIHGSSDNQSFSAAMAQLGTDIMSLRPSLANDSKTLLAEVDKILAQPEFSSIDQDFERKKKKSGKEPKWHAPLGPGTVRQIAKELQRLPEYELFYSKGSQVTHTGSYKDYVRFSKEHLTFKPVRRLDGISALLKFTFSLAFRCYEMVLKNYRPGEMKSFATRYVREWREPFLSIKDVTYKS